MSSVPYPVLPREPRRERFSIVDRLRQQLVRTWLVFKDAPNRVTPGRYNELAGSQAGFQVFNPG